MNEWPPKPGSFTYAESPLIEALCEVGTVTGAPWRDEIPRELHDRVKDRYPDHRVLRTFEATVHVQGTGVTQGLAHGQRDQFLTPDGTQMLQVAPNLIAVNRLKPYLSWDQFKPAIMDALGTYWDLVNAAAIGRAHLRYINRVILPGPNVELDDWFEFGFRPPKFEDDSAVVGAFMVGTKFPFGSTSFLRAELTSGGTEGEAVAIMLDLEYTSQGDDLITMEGMASWLDEAHGRIESAWLGCITSNLHSSLKPETRA